MLCNQAIVAVLLLNQNLNQTGIYIFIKPPWNEVWNLYQMWIRSLVKWFVQFWTFITVVKMSQIDNTNCWDSQNSFLWLLQGQNNKIQKHFYTHALLVNIANVINYRRGKIRLIMINKILQRSLASILYYITVPYYGYRLLHKENLTPCLKEMCNLLIINMSGHWWSNLLCPCPLYTG